MWHENRQIFKAILTDILLFLLALAALFGGYKALHALEVAGYPHDRVARFEALHYWAYLSVDGLFLSDLVVKLFVSLFLRHRR